MKTIAGFNLANGALIAALSLAMAGCGDESNKNTSTPSPSVDTEAPVIQLLGAASVDVIKNSNYVDAGVTVTDNVDKNLTASQTGTVDTAVTGTYTLTFNATDTAGNVAQAVTRTVVVKDATGVDTEAPVITLVGAASVTINLNDTYIDLGATASDNVDGNITSDIVVDATAVDSSTIGAYTVTYNVMDAAGNVAADVTRQVNVVEANSAIITNGDFATALGDEWYFELGGGIPTIINGELVIVDLSPGGNPWEGRLVQQTDSVLLMEQLIKSNLMLKLNKLEAC
ncbi:immunoglobulin-like domain-containing protein [Psychromonas sp. MME1]|uniref:immunoglobulin-like domain-containing protein n=1 Tax=Psychromonas sp. MME1 TaxID=3231032 RepID=UPI0034E1BC80